MPETPEAIRGLADTMITRFTPPSFVPGCEVKSIADIDEYTTNNGWIEAIVGGDNQQRVRYYGTPQGVAVNDFVDVEYFPAYKLYRVFGSTLGGTASVGGVRVSEIWDSDFSDVAMSAGTVNLTVNGTRTLTIPTDLIHAGDTDTKISFTDDAIEVTAGNISMLKLTETTQNLVEIGDTAGGGDVDVNFNDGQLFIRGSDGRIGFSDDTLPSTYTFYHPTQTAVQLRTSANSLSCVFIGQTSNGSKASPTATGSGRILMRFSGGGYDGSVFTDAQAAIDMYSEELFSATNQGTNIRFLNTPLASVTNTERMRLTAAGYLGINRTSPQGMLHGYDSISGFEHWKYNGLDGTSRTILPNGTGDVLFYLAGIYVMRNSAGVAVSGSVAVANGGTQNITVGADTVTITVAGTGATTIARSAGSNTIRVGLWLLWL